MNVPEFDTHELRGEGPLRAFEPRYAAFDFGEVRSWVAALSARRSQPKLVSFLLGLAYWGALDEAQLGYVCAALVRLHQTEMGAMCLQVPVATLDEIVLLGGGELPVPLAMWRDEDPEAFSRSRGAPGPCETVLGAGSTSEHAQLFEAAWSAHRAIYARYMPRVVASYEGAQHTPFNPELPGLLERIYTPERPPKGMSGEVARLRGFLESAGLMFDATTLFETLTQAAIHALTYLSDEDKNARRVYALCATEGGCGESGFIHRTLLRQGWERMLYLMETETLSRVPS